MRITKSRLRRLISEALSTNDSTTDTLDLELIELIEQFCELASNYQTYNDITGDGNFTLNLIKSIAKSDDYDKYQSWLNSLRNSDHPVRLNIVARFALDAVFLDAKLGISAADDDKFMRIDELLDPLKQALDDNDKQLVINISKEIIKLLTSLYGALSREDTFFIYRSLSFHCKSLHKYSLEGDEKLPQFLTDILIILMCRTDLDLNSSVEIFLEGWAVGDIPVDGEGGDIDD